MATWKKVVVSGSNISQLNNDANYLTAGTLVVPNSFSTASFNGTSIISNSTTGSLNFASSSGQGLTISANAGTDTLTFGLSAIPNTSLANSAITIAGTSTSLGGSISQATILAGSGVWSGSAQLPAGIVSASVLSSATQGTVVLTTNGVAGSTVDLGLETTDSPSFAGVTAGNITVGITTDNTINTTSGNLTINSAGGVTTVDDDLVVSGDLTVNGTTTYINTTNLYVEDPFVLLASGSGNNASDGGIVIDRGAYSGGNVAVAYDKEAVRWGFQNGLSDSVTDVTLADGTGTSAAFAGLVFTQAAHGATKPTTGEFAVQGAIYTATNEDIWIYS